jgi:hypothetical protein
VLLASTGRVSGTALRVRVNGASGVKVTGIVALRLPAVAVTVATPATVELSVAVATPPTVVAVAGARLPRLAVKLTVVPSATGLPILVGDGRGQRAGVADQHGVWHSDQRYGEWRTGGEGDQGRRAQAADRRRHRRHARESSS